MGRGSSKVGGTGGNTTPTRRFTDEQRDRAREIAQRMLEDSQYRTAEAVERDIVDSLHDEFGIPRSEARELFNSIRDTARYHSDTAETYNMNETALNVARRGGEGTFIRTNIPMLVRTDDGDGIEIRTEQGYATVVDGTPVFIQRARGGYHYNVYGMTASREPMRTLAEAKNVDNIRSRLTALREANNTLESARDTFNMANVEGGISMDAYRRRTRRR